MATSRIDMRIDESVKAAAEKAAALQGMKTLTEYITRLIKEDSERVIRAAETITLQNDPFDRFIQACEAALAPSNKLRDALELTKERNIQ